MQGLDSFLMSVIIHDLSTGELVNEWYRCVLCDPMGRTAFVGVRKKSVLELNPKRWIRFWKVDRDEEADWPFHFNVKIHPVNHSQSKLELLFHCHYAIFSVLATKEAVANTSDQIKELLGAHTVVTGVLTVCKGRNNIFPSFLWFLFM